MKVTDQLPYVERREGEVGLEVEVEGDNVCYQDMRGRWREEDDGSLRGDGVEYVLRRPCSRDKVDSVLEELSDHFEARNWEIDDSDRCGVHVHINCQDLEVTQVFNFIVLYLIVEDALTRYCGEDREGNLFCLRARDAAVIIDLVGQAMKDDDLRSFNDQGMRYSSMNLASLGKYGSLEFRALKTPTNLMEIRTWVQMLLAVKDASLKYEMPSQILNDLSVHGANNFVLRTFGPLAILLAYDTLDDDIMYAARQIQLPSYQYQPRPDQKLDIPKTLHIDDEAPVPEGMWAQVGDDNWVGQVVWEGDGQPRQVVGGGVRLEPLNVVEFRARNRD